MRLTVFHFSETGPLRARYERAGAELIHVPISSLFSVVGMAGDAPGVKKLADARELSLLHAHCVYANILGAGLVRLPGRRFAVSWPAVDGLGPFRGARWGRSIALHKAWRVVCSSMRRVSLIRYAGSHRSRGLCTSKPAP